MYKPRYKVILLLILLVCGICFFFGKGSNDNSNPATNQSISDQSSSAEIISLLGYSSIELAANTIEQDMTFSNPKENNCYIKVSILLSDGSILWTSDLIAPGNTSDTIKLTTALSEGTYKNSVLKYDCYTIDTLAALNGAQNAVTIIVQ